MATTCDDDNREDGENWEEKSNLLGGSEFYQTLQ